MQLFTREAGQKAGIAGFDRTAITSARNKKEGMAD
jgi:hypothetical protein